MLVNLLDSLLLSISIIMEKTMEGRDRHEFNTLLALSMEEK